MLINILCVGSYFLLAIFLFWLSIYFFKNKHLFQQDQDQSEDEAIDDYLLFLDDDDK